MAEGSPTAGTRSLMTSMTGPLGWPALLLGFALGGFFDGILLHQILQWHHLLSSVEGLEDLRTQVLADGLFHAVMYLIAAVALILLWRHRATLRACGDGAMLWGAAAIGFGAWHLVDGILSHWLIGLHRIKMDSPTPLMWDLIWFVVFGIVPVVLGRRMRRGGHGGPGGGTRAAAALAVAALVGGPLAALPAKDTGQVMVLFAPGISAGSAFDALARADATVLWSDRSGGLWAVKLEDRRAAWRLYRSGALLVGNSATGFGCLAWSRTV